MPLVFFRNHMWDLVRIMCKNLFFAKHFCGHTSFKRDYFCRVVDTILWGILRNVEKFLQQRFANCSFLSVFCISVASGWICGHIILPIRHHDGKTRL